MNLPKILACAIFILLGLLVLLKGIRSTRTKGIRNSFVDIAAGIGFIFIGLLIGLGYID